MESMDSDFNIKKLEYLSILLWFWAIFSAYFLFFKDQIPPEITQIHNTLEFFKVNLDATFIHDVTETTKGEATTSTTATSSTTATTTRTSILTSTTQKTTTKPPIPSLSDNTFQFKFDSRPNDILYKSPKEEVTMCICGDFDCTEQPHISRLFSEPRPTFQQYKASLNDPKLRTSVKNSIYAFKQNTLVIQAVDGNGLKKIHGGDFWIARLRGVLNKYEQRRLNRAKPKPNSCRGVLFLKKSTIQWGANACAGCKIGDFCQKS